MATRAVSLLRWLPLAAALVYAVVLVRQLGSIVAQLVWNSDYDSQMVIAESIGESGKRGRAIIVQAGYFWFDLATRPLPYHRQIWEYAPYLMALVALALLVWVAGNLVGRFAAVLTAAIGIAASPLVLATQVAQAYHGTTWLGTCALAAYLCWLFRLGVSRWRWTGWLIPPAAAIVTGLATETDPLLLATGVAPFLAADMLVWRLRSKEVDRHAAGVGLGTVSTAAAVGGIFLLGTRLAGYASTFPRGLDHIVLRQHLAGNVRQLVSGVFEVAGMPHAGSLLGILLGLVLFAALLVPPVWLARALFGGTTAPLLAMIMFWTASELFICLAFVFSDVPSNFLENSARYLVPLFYVAVAIVPLWAGASPKRLAAVAVPASVFILSNAAAVNAGADARAFAPYPTSLDKALAFLEDHGLTRGYAGYWEASPLTWNSELAVRIRPVTEVFFTADDMCGPATVCPFAYNSVSDWYRGKDGPTFILIDPNVDYLQQPPSAALDTTIAQYKVDHFLIYVYADDVASHMAIPRKFTRQPF